MQGRYITWKNWTGWPIKLHIDIHRFQSANEKGGKGEMQAHIFFSLCLTTCSELLLANFSLLTYEWLKHLEASTLDELHWWFVWVGGGRFSSRLDVCDRSHMVSVCLINSQAVCFKFLLFCMKIANSGPSEITKSLSISLFVLYIPE